MDAAAPAAAPPPPRPLAPAPAGAAGVVAAANLVRLCSELRLPVVYKVFERVDGGGADATDTGPDAAGGAAGGASQHAGVSAAGAAARRAFLVVVHVLSDHAFRKFQKHACRSDLPLHRGLLLKVGGRRARAGCARAEGGARPQQPRRRPAHRYPPPPPTRRPRRRS
jgi:hypothetical protein